MADLATLEKALRNADAAGDTDAARMFAQEITKMRATPAASTPEASTFDKALGSVPGRFAKGVVDPFIGLAQLGANALGQGDWANQKVNELEAAKQRGMAAHGTEGFDWAGLAGSLAPGVGIAKGVSKVLPVAKTLLGRMGIGAATGAVAAGVQPIADSEDYAKDKAVQTGAGAVVGGAIPAAVQAVQGVKAAVEPFYESGRKAIIGRALDRAAGGQSPTAIQALERAKEIVPGSRPTVGQASQNAGLASLERAATSTSPEATVAAQMRTADQNYARSMMLDKVAGTPQMMADAVKNRKVATTPLIQRLSQSTAEVNPSRTVNLIDKIIKGSPGRTQLTDTLENVKKSLYEPYPLEQRGKEAWDALNALQKQRFGAKDIGAIRNARTVMDRVKTGKIDVDEALSQLKGIAGKHKDVSDALAAVKDAIKAPDQRLRSNASELYQGARKNMTDLLHAKAGDGSKVNEAISRELSVVMKSLDHQINKAEPAYGKFLNKYSELSQPISQMKIGQAVSDKATNATGNVQLNALNRALTDKTAQKATGFKRATLEKSLTPEQLGNMQAVKDDLVRAMTAQQMAGSAGSDTVKKLAYTNMIDRAGVPTFLREFAPTQTIGNFMARGADTVYGRANNEIAEELAQTLLDPKMAAQIMRQVGPGQYGKLVDMLTQQATGATGTAIGRGQ